MALFVLACANDCAYHSIQSSISLLRIRNIQYKDFVSKTWKIHGKQKQFTILFLSKKIMLHIICKPFLQNVGALFKKKCPPFVSPFQQNGSHDPKRRPPIKRRLTTPRFQRTGHPSSGGHESLACSGHLARGGTGGTQLWRADLGQCP